MKPYETLWNLWNPMKSYEILWNHHLLMLQTPALLQHLPDLRANTARHRPVHHHAAHGDAFRNAPQRGKELVVLHGREGRQQHDDHPTGGQQIGVAQLQGVQSTADLLGAVNSELAVGEGAVGWFLMGSRDNHKKESEGNFIDDFPRETVIFHRI